MTYREDEALPGSERSPSEPGSSPDVLRTIFANCLQFAGLVSPEGTLLETNPASLAFVGEDRESVVGRPFWETPWWTTDADRERLRRAIRRAAEGELVRYELRTVDADGDVAVFDFSLVPVRGPDEAVVSIVAEGREITDLYRAREALRESEARLTAILAGTLDAIVSIDDEQRIRLFNRGAERIFGYEADEVLGERLDLLIPEEFRRTHGAHVEEFARSADTARRMGERGEIAGRRKGGEVFPAEASISKAAVDRRTVYTVVLRDVSERRDVERQRARLAEAQRQARLDAEAATRARDEMLRIVSHDLRNPVTGVLMGTRMLRRQLGADHPALEFVEGIELAAERQRRLIMDLSDVASIEAGRLSIERAPHELAAIFRTVVRSFESAAAEQEIELVRDAVDGLPPVSVDRDRIVQVLSNLVDNALKATPAGGSIRLGAYEADGRVHVVVRDTGSGIPDAENDRVFERFWRGTTGGSPGSGLGLAIARGIVEGHGGEIDVESAPGEGSTFRFDLPIAE